MPDVIVLGAGIVGVCVAIHLQRRGRNVLLVDRRTPGRETSFGNAGIIQAEGVTPHPFPRDLGMLFSIAGNHRLDAGYDPLALPGYAVNLARYWWHSSPPRYARIVADYAPLIAQAVPEHADLITAAGADDLIERKGWLLVFRTQQALDNLSEVVKRFPDSPYARDARLKVELAIDHLAGKEMDIGRYYQKQGIYIAAINRYRTVIERYQSTTHVPEALNRLVESYTALGVKSEAQSAASVLGYNFPGSDWYADSYYLLTGEDYRPPSEKTSHWWSLGLF